jgi:outer membrane protein OmpA-like peptidoglycan-associated protein
MAHMLTAPTKAHIGRSMRALMLIGGVALSSTSALAQTAPPTPPPTPIAFEQALMKAANDLFSKANLPAAPARIRLVIDPLIDGSTGAQSVATRSIEQRIAELVRTSYRRFEIRHFSAAAIADLPVVLVGTFTAINNAGDAGGPRDAYRICLTLADLETKRIVSKGVARAQPEGIDTTPVAFFADSPAFIKDPATDAYIKTCQASRLGDTIDPAYVDGLQVATLLNDAIQAYDAKRYLDALGHYERALRTPGGEQLRVLNGLYLTNWKLDRREAARESFERIVGYGVKADRLAVKFLFEPNAAQFTSDRETRLEYSMWVQEIAKGTVKTDKCLDVVGHTSATGSALVNDQLSLQRADYVKGRLQGSLPRVKANRRFAAKGVGSRELIVGTGKDDATDFLDRRVEFKTITCAGPVAEPERVAKADRFPKGGNRASPRSKRNSESSDGDVAGLPRSVRSQVQRYLGPGVLKDLLDD